MNIFRPLIAGALVAGALTSTAPGPAQAAELTFRAATEVAEKGDIYLLLKAFKDEVESRSGGNIEVKLFSGGTLGSQRQLQEQLQLGAIQAIGTGSDIVELDPKFSIFDLPFLFDGRKGAYEAIDGGLGEALKKSLLETKNVRVLAIGEIGFRHITNNARAIKSPADLKGLKIRTPGNPLRITAFKALGAAPTPIPYKELYTALQQDVVDGQENPVGTLQELSLWDVQTHISLTGHVYTPAYVLVDEKWWSALDAGQQEILTAAAQAAKKRQRETLASQEGALLDKAKANGMTVTEPDLAAFAKLTEPVWAEFKDKHGAEYIELARP